MPDSLHDLPFYALLALLVFVPLYYLHRRRVRFEQRQYQLLETLMRQRTQELQAETQKASDAAAAKTLFMAHMSHEIRTPMNAIIGLAHLIQNTDLTPRQHDHVRKLERNGRHLLGVLNDILDFSKVEAGMLSIETIAFELDALLQEVVTMVSPMAYDKGLEFICVADPQVPRQLLGDPLRLTQILVNFLNHAIKQTRSGEVVLRVECCTLPQGTQAAAEADVGLRFTVQDSAVELTPAQCEQLFEGYLQPHSDLQRQLGARGLGLPVSKRLAEMMGGQAGVSTVAGGGNTLWFTARLQIDPHPAPAGLVGGSVEGLRALVVDDHPVAAQTLAELLKRLGLRVDYCHSGRDGLERMRLAERADDPYAVVLLDWEMPDWDGLQSAHHMAAAGLAQPPHLIIVTGHDKDEIAGPARAAGLNHILIKPVTASTLFEMLMRVIHSSGTRNSFGRAAPGNDFARLKGLRGAQILLVEDDEINQEVATEMLRLAGMQVDVASDGQSALDCVARKRYDLVLMDMQMPVMDGLTATRRLRSEPANQALPIIAMTANAMQSDRERCLAAGMNAFVAKPIEPQQLESALLEWLSPHLRGAVQQPAAQEK